MASHGRDGPGERHVAAVKLASPFNCVPGSVPRADTHTLPFASASAPAFARIWATVSLASGSPVAAEAGGGTGHGFPGRPRALPAGLVAVPWEDADELGEALPHPVMATTVAASSAVTVMRDGGIR